MFSSYRFWAKHRQIVRENAKNVDYLPKSSFYSTSVNDLSKTRLCKSRRQYFQNLKLCLMSSKKIYQELFNIQYYSLESGPITLLERDEECVKKLTFYDKTHATCDRVYINIPKTWEFYILEQISTWSSRLIMKLNSL